MAPTTLTRAARAEPPAAHSDSARITAVIPSPHFGPGSILSPAHDLHVDYTRFVARRGVKPVTSFRNSVQESREAEMLQAIDRLRLIHSPRRKTVYVLCNIPLDIPIDELVTWRELVGDGRLARALEACEEKGWEALPLAAKELTRLFPELWRTRKAAEDWARKNPLKSLTSIIKVWGV